MKKAISILAITAVIISAISITAFAHGGHGRGSAAAQQRYELCAVDSCDVVGLHQHNGTWYCSRTESNGNYQVCTVEGCAQLGLHEHDGAYYYCANQGTGHGCGRGWNR